MKVRVNFTVDVDPDSWAEEYGTHPRDLRRDVQDHARQSVLGLFDSLGVLL
jgi:hypothetical protein